MGCWHYAYSGLHVVSDVPLPEWDIYRLVPKSGAIDVSISCDTSGGEVLEPGGLISTDEQVDFVLPDIAAYQVRTGDTIRVRPARGAGWPEVRLFLLGTVWAALLYQRASFPLHGSVVRVGDGAVAFCGQSGAGKSTIAAWLLANGYHLLSDDLCRCEVSPNRPALVWPSTPRIKLWDDTLTLFGRNSSDLDRDHYRHDKFHLPWDIGSEYGSVQLRAVYLLQWGDPMVGRLRGGTAVQRLVKDGTYRPELLQTPAKLLGHWQACMTLAGTTDIWEFCRPRDSARLDEVMHMVVDDWDARSQSRGVLL